MSELPRTAEEEPAEAASPLSDQSAPEVAVADGATTETSDVVWMATRRKGLAYHRIQPGGRQTVCGRGILAGGERLPEGEAAETVQGDECLKCYGHVNRKHIQPRIAPRSQEF